MAVYAYILFFYQQLHAIIAASVSIKSSQKLKKILEVSCTLYTEPHYRAIHYLDFSYIPHIMQFFSHISHFIRSF